MCPASDQFCLPAHSPPPAVQPVSPSVPGPRPTLRLQRSCRVADELGATLAGVAAADTEAFERFYAATSAQVHALVRRVLRCPEQSAEVTQEVYLQVWQQASRFDPSRGHALSWVLTLAHRRAVDRVRRSVSATGADERWASRHELGIDDLVSETALARVDARAVRRSVAALTPVQREAVTLAYLRGYTGGEIAELLQVPLGTVKTRIRDGLIALRRRHVA